MSKGGGSGKTPARVVELLKEAVAEKGQSAVARESGLTQSAVHRYISGIGEPSTATLQKLAIFFGVSVEWLRGDESLRDAEEIIKILKDMIELFNISPEHLKDTLTAMMAACMTSLMPHYLKMKEDQFKEIYELLNIASGIIEESESGNLTE